MPWITNQNHWIIPLLILSIVLLFKTGYRGKITFAILIVGFAITDASIAQILKPMFGRIRPSHAIAEQINLLLGKGGLYSFPSNHAANSFMLASILGYFFDRIKISLFILAGIISFSRIYVGVHYPGDVIFGALYGYLVAWTVLSLWVMIKMRELKRGRTWVWYANES